jgi:hypothetical protein
MANESTFYQQGVVIAKKRDPEVQMELHCDDYFLAAFPVMPEPLVETSLGYKDLKAGMAEDIVAELGGKAEVSMAQIVTLLDYEGEDNPLLGCEGNIFFVRDEHNLLQLVNVTWLGFWMFHARLVEEYGWCEGGRVFFDG